MNEGKGEYFFFDNNIYTVINSIVAVVIVHK